MTLFFKKIVALFTVLVTVLASFPVVAEEVETSVEEQPEVVFTGGMHKFVKIQEFPDKFTDVKSSNWFYSSVKSAFELGLVKGVSETSFAPSDYLSVAETITLACRIYSTYMDDKYVFEATKPWYQAYVDYAYNNKIITKKYSNYSLLTTRSEFAKILSRTLPETEFYAINNVLDGNIPDVKMSDHFGEEVYMLYNAGIISGVGEERHFNPRDNIKRSEVAAIVSRVVFPNDRLSFKLNIPLTAMSFEKTSETVEKGQTKQLSLSLTPANASDEIIWTSDNSSVATVDNGVVTGVGAGSATITAKAVAKKLVAKCTVSVTVPEVWYEDGTYAVGTDIPSGDYYFLSTGGRKNAHVYVYNDNQPDSRAVISDSFKSFTIVRVKDGQYLKAANTRFSAANGSLGYFDSSSIKEGTYRVGTDIPAGQYHFEAENSGAYFSVYENYDRSSIHYSERFEDTVSYTLTSGQLIKMSDCFAKTPVAERVYVNDDEDYDDYYYEDEYEDEYDDDYEWSSSTNTTAKNNKFSPDHKGSSSTISNVTYIDTSGISKGDSSSSGSSGSSDTSSSKPSGGIFYTGSVLDNFLSSLAEATVSLSSAEVFFGGNMHTLATADISIAKNQIKGIDSTMNRYGALYSLNGTELNDQVKDLLDMFYDIPKGDNLSQSEKTQGKSILKNMANKCTEIAIAISCLK